MILKKWDTVKSGQIGSGEYNIMWYKQCGDENEEWCLKKDCKQAEIKTSKGVFQEK